MQSLHANEGDLVYISDQRFWLGGLRSIHAKAGKPHNQNPNVVQMTAKLVAEGDLLVTNPVTIEKIM